MRRFLVAFALLAGVLGSPAHAVRPDEVLPDPVLEGRARTLSAGLRCMVCQNQSIDDSDADLARDLRILLRERLVAGDSDEQVVDFLVARYGQYVLLKPQFNGFTAVLWLAPPLLVFVGGVFAVAVVRRRSKAAPEAVLSADEQKRLRSVLARIEPGA